MAALREERRRKRNKARIEKRKQKKAGANSSDRGPTEE